MLTFGWINTFECHKNHPTMRFFYLLIAGLLWLSGIVPASAQTDSTRRYYSGFEYFFGGQVGSYQPINELLTTNGYSGVRVYQPLFGIALSLTRPYDRVRPVGFDFSVTGGASHVQSEQSQTSLTMFRGMQGIGVDLVSKPALCTGPHVGIGLQATTFNMTQSFNVGSVNGYLGGQSVSGRNATLVHTTGLIDLSWRLSLTTGSRLSVGERRDNTFAIGYLLGFSRRNWSVDGNQTHVLSDGPALNAGGFYFSIGTRFR